MLLALLLLAPLVAILISFAKPGPTQERAGLVSSVVEVAAAAGLALHPTAGALDQAAFLPAFGAYLVLITSVIGLFSSAYSVGYIGSEVERRFISKDQARLYWILLRGFILFLYLATAAANPLFTWIFLEATTLVTAYLVAFYGKRSDVEAAWKYLIINSVGLLIAFFGTLFFLSAAHGRLPHEYVTWTDLAAAAGSLNPLTVKVAFVFILIGFGTKVGLAPLHTWRPDAYSKAPAPIVTLLSAALLNVAFLPILRFKAVADIAVGPAFASRLLFLLGLASIVLAGIFVLNQRNYKRLLAYSSVEHAGILALGFGFGGLATGAALLHMAYHALAKALLFFSAGNVFLKYGSPKIAKIRNLASTLPYSAMLLAIGVMAALGLPPFGMFLTELTILATGMASHAAVALVAMAGLALVFVGMIRQLSHLMSGQAEPDETPAAGEINAWTVAAPAGVLLILVAVSIWQPPFLQALLAGSQSFF